MANTTRIRARRNGRQIEILALVKHPMEAGPAEQPADYGTGPSPFIESMAFMLNDRVIAVADLGPNIDSNPLTGIAVSGAVTGDRVSVAWTDSGGGSGSAEATVT